MNTPLAHIDDKALSRCDQLIALVLSGLVTIDEAREQLGFKPRGGAADQLPAL